jgi:hypothetical protein
MRPLVVREVVASVFPVCDDHLWTVATDEGHQPARGLIEAGLVKTARIVVLGGAGHAGVFVAQEVEMGDAKNLDPAAELLLADLPAVPKSGSR